MLQCTIVVPYTASHRATVFQAQPKPRTCFMTTSTPLDNVIEHATETTRAANERVREFAQIGVRKATEGFEQISKAAQTASAEMSSQFVQARDGATQASLKLLQVAKEDAAD